ncbi:hypothetical protein FE257_001908 [Aspergillus nanangensis]|uniref:Uncharacterized protein n=1 Tax=Aspergillus nanangensis TaxID=2582783 RepID=A0AAD4GQD4_ASPNN|nr:hypothetical protein FE257_001908 [Aspergillus nanangensis]
METVDCVVVGAGLYGLAMAKQYHCTCPEDSLVILETEATLGGTWADHRLYSGLKSNNLLGTYEYPDFPMDSDKFHVNSGEHIPGKIIHEYLKSYASHFGIDDLIQFESKVLTAEHQDGAEGGWVLTITTGRRNEITTLFARRLVIATGLTSQPSLTRFDGQEAFGGKIFHVKEFPQNKDTIQVGKRVTVLGGSKFAWDVVYAYATAGVEVDWIIRSSGHGPCWMSPPYVTPFKRWLEKLANTRLLTWFSPCIWGNADGYTRIRNLLHQTVVGRFFVDCFWRVLGGDVLARMKYDSHPKTAKLKPWIGAMFAGTSFSILNYEVDFFELIKGDLVDIHISDIDYLSQGKVHLTDGAVLKSDALVAHTGWDHKPPVKFLPEGIEHNLGLPHVLPDKEIVKKGDQHLLIEGADGEIRQRFPRLSRPPVWDHSYTPLADQNGVIARDDNILPYMLHRFMVPPSERLLRTRDIAFAGMVCNFSNPICAHIQGLWISAYLSGRLLHSPAAAVGEASLISKLRYEAVLHNRFGKWRYPVDWGDKNPSFILDAVPYLDMLLRDLGLNVYRKPGIWSEMWDPYGPDDYTTVNEEWEAAKYSATS